MNDQAKQALYRICGRDGNGDEKEVKKILDEYPYLLNGNLNPYGDTILILACRYNHINVMKYLLTEQQLNINQQNSYGWTALHWAYYNGSKEKVELLLLHCNIDINIRNKKGKLPVEVCCEGIPDKSNKPIILELLMNHSTIVTAFKQSGEGSPVFLYKSVDHEPINKLEENEGSKIIGEMSGKDFSRVVEGREYLKFHIQALENSVKDLNLRLQEKECTIIEMKKNMNQMDKRLLEKEKECLELRDRMGRMEDRFENWMKQMENNNKALEKRFQENERVAQLQDYLGSPIKCMTLPLPPNKQTHVFLTHTWKEDEKGRNNHDRVRRVNQALQERGLMTWFDSERMEDKIHETITKALYSTCCVLIFVTREYERKVNAADDSDYCFYEFNVAANDPHLAKKRIPVIMDESMVNLGSWDQGLLKAGLGGKVFINLSSDEKDEFEERCNEVVERVVKLLNIHRDI